VQHTFQNNSIRALRIRKGDVFERNLSLGDDRLVTIQARSIKLGFSVEQRENRKLNKERKTDRKKETKMIDAR